MALFTARQTFAIPTAAATYAAEVYTMAAPAGTVTPELSAVTVSVQSCPAGAVFELWLPDAVASAGGTPPNVSTDYYNTGLAITGVGGNTWPLAGVRGAQIRARSVGAGAPGSAVVSVWAQA